jgi:hypothetical protein
MFAFHISKADHDRILISGGSTRLYGPSGNLLSEFLSSETEGIGYTRSTAPSSGGPGGTTPPP